MRITVFVNVMYEGPRSALSHSSISGRLFLGMYLFVVRGGIASIDAQTRGIIIIYSSHIFSFFHKIHSQVELSQAR